MAGFLLIKHRLQTENFPLIAHAGNRRVQRRNVLLQGLADLEQMKGAWLDGQITCCPEWLPNDAPAAGPPGMEQQAIAGCDGAGSPGRGVGQSSSRCRCLPPCHRQQPFLSTGLSTDR